MGRPGRLLGLGVGPGDPELITLKALRRLREAPVVAYLAAKDKKGYAFAIVEEYLRPEQTVVPLGLSGDDRTSAAAVVLRKDYLGFLRCGGRERSPPISTRGATLR